MRRALDLFCGGGGAARGILAAGFDEIVGIDIKDHRKSYPGHFIRGDALNPPVRLEDFDFVWASPPCQAYSASKVLAKTPKDHPKLIEQVRALVRGARVFVIENVPGSPLRNPVKLCGGSFGLGATGPDGVYRPLKRHRLFETNIKDLAWVPGVGCRCRKGQKIGVWGNGGRWVHRKPGYRGGYTGSRKESAEAMGLPEGMSKAVISEAVPPVYAEFIAREALRQMH